MGVESWNRQDPHRMSEFPEPPFAPDPPSPPTNEAIARALERTADLLEARDDNPFRVRAFRRAAQSVLRSKESISDLTLAVGPAALKRLPGIGEGLAGVIDGFVRSGGQHLVYRGVGDVTPVAVLTSLPGIGEVLARRILDLLQI